jgi:hypothetical protein
LQVQINYKHFTIREIPLRNSLMNIVRKCEETRFVSDNLKGVAGRKRAVRTDKTV